MSCDEGISTEIGAGRFSDNESKSGVTGPGTSSDLGDNKKEPNDDWYKEAVAEYEADEETGDPIGDNLARLVDMTLTETVGEETLREKV